MRNEGIDAKLYFLPFVTLLLATFAQSVLFMLMDSVVGRGCVTLMISEVYKGRILPIAWIVVKGKKDHLKEEIHLKLIEQMHQINPFGAQVFFLGDGELDGIKLPDAVDDYGWKYVCRTARSSMLFKGAKKTSYRRCLFSKGRPREVCRMSISP